MAIRILHVGVGVRGQHWLDIVRDYPDAISVGCVDPVPVALQVVSGKYPNLPCFRTPEEALQKIEVDAAVIASPPPLHAENALSCLDAGLAVMIEKPLGLNVGEALKVIECGERLCLPVIAAQNYRFNPAERTLRRLVQEERLGKITSVQCISRRYRSGKGTFLGSMDYPQMIDDGVHHFDSLRSILGTNFVSALARPFNPPWCDYRNGAATEALIEMEKGIHVQYLGSLVSHRYGFSLWVEGEKGVIWTNRTWVLSRRRGSRWFWPVKIDRVPKGDEAPYPRGGTTSLLNHLRDAILRKQEPETNGRDNLWNLAMLEACRLSAQEKREVRIEEVLKRANLNPFSWTPQLAEG